MISNMIIILFLIEVIIRNVISDAILFDLHDNSYLARRMNLITLEYNNVLTANKNNIHNNMYNNNVYNKTLDKNIK